jgi:hypothetical protein
MNRARRLLERRSVQPTPAGKRAYRLLTVFIVLIGVWWFDWISDYLHGISPSLHGQALVDAVRAFVSRLAGSGALAMLIVGACSAYKGWQTLAAGEYPYPGMWVDHEMRLLIGAEAQRRGRRTLHGGVLWLLAAGPVAWVMYHALDVLYAG